MEKIATAMYKAIIDRDEKAVKEILENEDTRNKLANGAEIGFLNVTLQSAVVRDEIEISKMLIDAGADVTADGDFSLQCAARNGLYEMSKLLLEHGASPDSGDSLPIKCAISYKHKKVAELLLKNAKRRDEYLFGVLNDAITTRDNTKLDDVFSAYPVAKGWDSLLLRQAYYLAGSEKAKKLLESEKE